MTRIRTLLMIGAAVPLAACGADDIASPGEGVIVVPAPAPSPTPTPSPSPSPTPTPTPPAASCPTGTTDAGLITTVNGERRNCQLSGRINGNLALAKVNGAIYSLSGRVDVGTDVGGNGQAAGGTSAILTIDPGVVIFASSGNDFLVVNRGSRLIAEGTATNPIIFTARGNVIGTTTDNSQGLWGGVVMLGRAPISDCLAGAVGGAVDCQQNIEGTTNALYGGNVANDTSGSMRFVQIRYSGFAIATGNELQGLTTGGVGSGTTFENIQVHNSSDDGVEFFGGRQNVRYLVVSGADDDSIDTDFGYKGNMQFLIAVQRGTGSGDTIIEADSNGNEDATPRQNTRLSNFTFIHRSTVAGVDNAILLRGGTDYSMFNGIITSPGLCIDIDGTATVQAANAAIDENGPPVFDSVVLACTAGPFENDSSVDAAAVATIFNAGTNNSTNFTPTLTNVFVNGANETARTPFNASTVNSFFQNTTYIGAVRDANDTWYQGWTCNAGYVSFGATSTSCTALPANA